MWMPKRKYPRYHHTYRSFFFSSASRRLRVKSPLASRDPFAIALGRMADLLAKHGLSELDLGSMLAGARRDMRYRGLMEEMMEAAEIDGAPCDAARHLPDVGLAGGEERGVRTAVAHRDAEALRGTDRDVRTPLPRRCEKRQCEKVGGGDDGQIRVGRALGEGRSGIVRSQMIEAGLLGVGEAELRLAL